MDSLLLQTKCWHIRHRATVKWSTIVALHKQRNDSATIYEEFLWFITLERMGAETIAYTIIGQVKQFDLNLDKFHGQGYDGCLTMPGKDNGVQAHIRNTYPTAVFVHCSSHRLNSVVHGLYSATDVRSATRTMKYII